MYIVHLSNPTRQVRIEANTICVIDGFITFNMRTHAEDYAPAAVAVFRAEDVTSVYNQDNIHSVIDLPSIGNGNRIPIETSRRTNEVDLDYAPAIIRQVSTATQARQYPPLSDAPQMPSPIPYWEETVSVAQDSFVTAATVGNSAMQAVWGNEDAEPALRREGRPVSFAIPPAHPIPPRPTRERYEVSADNMSRSQSYGQSLAVGENF